jgi:hypothetical protein
VLTGVGRLQSVESCITYSIKGADMMKLHYSMCGAVLSSEHVSMMRGLLKEHCENRQYDRQSAEAEHAARGLLWWYQNGVTEQERLRHLLAISVVRGS